MERITPKESTNGLIIEFMFLPFKFTEMLNVVKGLNSQHKRILITHVLKYTDVALLRGMALALWKTKQKKTERTKYLERCLATSLPRDNNNHHRFRWFQI